MNPTLTDGPAGADDPLLAEVVAEVTDRLRAGGVVDLEAYAARHPGLAGPLRELFPALRLLGAMSGSGAPGEGPARSPVEPPPEVRTLGDFRPHREVGRGGMGVVYEAEQVSLGRRVALKVLPSAGLLDPRQLRRFQNEARAAAYLHHTNIVPVYAVGCERGVHFYAMQFIDGHNLADLLRLLCRAAAPPADTLAAAPPAAGDGRTAPYEGSPEEPAAPDAATGPPAGRDTLFSTGPGRGRDYFRRVAELGAQAADALDHAHQLGIVHRDVKPGNLLVDAAGRLWVTDFGLAQFKQVEASLTQTGDLVGTLRYMSPEQALAKRVVVDHRTDVYSLGATLYELLALRPAFGGRDRQELLRQIAFEDPKPPRRVDRRVPRELETVALKALEKRPEDRYRTAAELADDLRRWLDDRPIRARRPSWGQVAARWSRRHRVLVGSVAAVLLAVAAVLGANAYWWAQRRAGAEAAAREALGEADRLGAQERWPEALSAARRASEVLAGVGADPALVRQAKVLGRELEMVRRLEEARLEGAATSRQGFDRKAVDSAYAKAFAWYGLDVDGADPQEVANRVRSSPFRAQLAAALDDWARLRRVSEAGNWKRPLTVARAVDPDLWRDRLRDALEGKRPLTPEELTDPAPGQELPPAVAPLLNHLTSGTAAAERAAVLLGRIRQRHPDDFWANHELGMCHDTLPSPRPQEAVRFFSIAVALRPQSPGAHFNLGIALKNKGLLDEAAAEYREAIRLRPDYAQAHNNLGAALAEKDQWDEAAAEFREALRLKPDHAFAHNNLGNALRAKGRLDEAATEFREALRLKPDDAEAHNNLGTVLRDKGRLDEAVAEHREALRLKPDHADTHYNLGNAFQDKGRLDEAAAEYREAIRLKPDDADAHNNLGNVLRDKGRLDEAASEFREALRLKPDYALAHNNLGSTLMDKGLLDEAVAEYREAIRLKPNLALAHKNLGVTLTNKGLLDEAAAELREAIRIQPNYAEASEQLCRVEGMARLANRLPAVLGGKDRPRDTAESIGFAELCNVAFQKRYAAAARFYAEAFAAEPKLAEQLDDGHRYNAACAAALAGCGRGEDAAGLDEKERARLRRQALDWLRADLDARRGRLEREKDKARPDVLNMMTHWRRDPDVVTMMTHWQQDPDLAGVRGEAALAGLPEAERGAWRALWTDVGRTLAEARGAAAPKEKGAGAK
jgi:tetratricopeptide (TPR) repeat protein/predicted Ser/Thr protein kinase